VPPREQGRDGAPETCLERAGEQHNPAMDDDDMCSDDLGHVERARLAALIEDAEQDRGENDADRMRTPPNSATAMPTRRAPTNSRIMLLLVAQDDVAAPTPPARARTTAS